MLITFYEELNNYRNSVSPADNFILGGENCTHCKKHMCIPNMYTVWVINVNCLILTRERLQRWACTISPPLSQEKVSTNLRKTGTSVLDEIFSSVSLVLCDFLSLGRQYTLFLQSVVGILVCFALMFKCCYLYLRTPGNSAWAHAARKCSCHSNSNWQGLGREWKDHLPSNVINTGGLLHQPQ